MKIYLKNDSSGGWSLERHTMTGRGHHLIKGPAMVANRHDCVMLSYNYDILGIKAEDKDIKNSLLKKGELE